MKICLESAEDKEALISGQQRTPMLIVNLTPYIATVMKIDAATASWCFGLDSMPMTEWWFL
jgi:hypothetical protein